MYRAVSFVCEVLATVPGFESSVTVNDVGLDIAVLESDASLKPTTRKQLIDARIGQGEYRQGLEKLWDNKCAVLGITNRRVLRASHVKPWKLSNNNERLDPHNGLLLAAHLDALFDAGLITFTSSGDMIVAPELSKSDREQLRLGARLRREPSGKLAEFLEIHRREFDAHHVPKTTPTN
jgi:predicted restriction endonuclease